MYIGDGRKTLKFAVRISASYLLYAMNKLRLSAYLCTPSGNPKLCLGSVCPFCTIFPKPGGRSHLFAPKTTASSRFKLHSALRLRKQHAVYYPHIGIKIHAQVAAFYEFKPLSPKQPRKVGSAAKALCAHFGAHSRSKRDFSRKRRDSGACD